MLIIPVALQRPGFANGHLSLPIGLASCLAVMQPGDGFVIF
jgi:hypothetical protein